jgi:molybdopterin synthase sulfur carrier subunit
MSGGAFAAHLRGRNGLATGFPRRAAVRVLIPNPLRSYTADATVVGAEGSTLGGVLADLDRRYRGIRFRIIDEQGQIRRHIKFFINGAQARDLDAALGEADEVMIVCALSGG